MSWSERQRDMLAAMGIRLWDPLPSPARGETAAVADNSAAPPAPVARRADTVAPRAPAVPTAPGGTDAATAPVPEPAPVAAVAPVAPPAAPGERAAAIAALDWPSLKDAVAACTACGLCTSRRQTVFGVGHARAHWMVVGEAPGEQEDLAGEPFVGPAGQLLDQMLRAAGLSRRAPDGSTDDGAGDPARRVFIANTLKCRPPRNRNPEPDELLQCEPFLRRQIALVQPKIILALGRFAVKTLLGTDEAIGKLRGRVHRFEGLPVVVSYHPAYLLRNLPDKAKAWDDLCLAMAAAERG